MATERVTIVVSSKGVVTVKKEFDELGKSARTSASGVDVLKGALAGLTAYLSVATITRYADSFTNVQNRLKTVTQGTDELAAATNSLFNIASSTYSSFEGVSTIFTRTAAATKDLGYSTQDALKFTEQLSKATALSGVSAASANAALVQLSQGLASGTLRGEELNSVLEQLPYAAQMLAKGLNVPIGKLREMGQAGTLTPKMIIDAFNKMSGTINADFAELTPTISMGLQTIETGFLRLIRLLESNTGAFGAVGQALVFVGNNLEYFAIALAPVALGLTVLAARSVLVASAQGLGAMLSALQLLVPALTLARTALVALNLAFLANPIVLVTTAIIALLGYVYLFSDEINSLTDLWNAFVDTAVNAINTVIEYMNKFLNFVSGGAWSIDIQNNGAAEAIADAGAKAGTDMNASITSGGATAADSLRGGMDTGTTNLKTAVDASFTKGGETVKKSIDAGSTSLASAISQVFKDAVSWFKSLFASASKSGSNSSDTVSKGDKSSSGTTVRSHSTDKNAYGFRTGGQFTVGGNGGPDSQMVNFRASPNERVTVETPAQQRQSDATKTAPAAQAKQAVNITNQVDPRGMVDVMGTRAGRDNIYNAIQLDPGRVRRALGL